MSAEGTPFEGYALYTGSKEKLSVLMVWDLMASSGRRLWKGGS